MLFGFAVAERVWFSGDVMPGVRVDGVDVAGLDEEAAYREISALAAELERAPLVVSIDGVRHTADPTLVGVDVDEGATLRAARMAARSRNPVEQTAGAVLRRFRDDDVALRVEYSRAGVEGLLDGWQAATLDGMTEGDLRFEGTTVVVIEPQAGRGIQREGAKALIDSQLRGADRSPITLPTGTVAPAVSRSEVERAATAARELLGRSSTIVAPPARVEVTPELLAAALGTERRGTRLELVIDPARLRTALGPQLAAIETPPADATFEVSSDGSVHVVPAVAGRQLDMEAVAAAILAGEAQIDATLVDVVPERDTAWAESLGITHQVSSFTTRHNSGEERVKNIHRAADLIDNWVVEPGEVFSLNEAVGPRTAERGFVNAPVWYGEFTEDLGGGVSQLATTLFNAAWFGGYEDVFHKPHSIYISRYPMGREATVDFHGVDLRFRNDTAAGVLVRTSYSDTSITVTLFGDNGGRTVTEVDRKILAEHPIEDRYYDCPGPSGLDKDNVCAGLADRATRRVAEGHTGIDVEFFRLIEQPGKEPIRERFFWRYKMTPNQYLVGIAPATTPTAPGPTTVAPPAVPAPTTTPAPAPTVPPAAPPPTTP